MTTPTEGYEQPWLFLIHQIPPKPDRLPGQGAVAIKNSVYVLPATEQAMEDFQWILREVVEGGGEALICRSLGSRRPPRTMRHA